jgi:hypothetical protein
MSNTTKNILSGIVTYILTRVSYWFFNFHPTNEFTIFLGLIIDISIWVVLYFLVLWLFGIIVKSNVAAK